MRTVLAIRGYIKSMDMEFSLYPRGRSFSFSGDEKKSPD